MNNILILKHLLKNKDKKYSINMISKELSINYRIAHEQTKKLEQEKLIKLEKVGNSSICCLTNKFNEKIFSAEFERRKDLFNKYNYLKKIYSRLIDLTDNSIILLFGSYANNTNTKHSDIDLLIIGGNEKKLKETINLIPKNIHFTFVSPKLFLDMINSKKMSVGTEAMNNNIIIFGIENYYKLINH